MKKRGISAHDEEAAQYDQQVREYEYYIHDVLFGMSFEYITAQDRLLDIGIGTGLAALPFGKAGLEVFGFDGSTEMLKICESKSFAKELKIFDLGYHSHLKIYFIPIFEKIPQKKKQDDVIKKYVNYF